MPRDTKHIQEAQKHRIRIREKGTKYIPGTVTLQVLGTGAPGSPACVYIFTDQSRYLFNCGEGTQRLAHEHKTKLARLEHIFITQTTWRHVGGLPGLSLTIQDAGVPEVTLHGPPGLEEIFRAMRRFVVLRDLKVHAIECESSLFYEDNVMRVDYVPLIPKGRSEMCESIEMPEAMNVDETDYYSHEKGSNMNSGRNSQESEAQGNSVKQKPIRKYVVSYICKLKPRPGVLSLEKCVDRGVPPGPLLGQLKNGIDVTLPNGVLVKADEVRGPDDKGPLFIFIDIPDEEYLQCLMENKHVFAKHQATATEEESVAAVVVHFTPKEIVERKEYIEFMDDFTPSTKHIILNESNNSSGNISVHRIQWQLNQLNDLVFPILAEQNATNSSVPSMASFCLRPRKGYDTSLEPKIVHEEYIDEVFKVHGFSDALGALKKQQMDKLARIRQVRDGQFPKFLFLGTGSCIPNKTRNVSAIFVETSKDSSFLLDCGEGTLGQMLRFYGNEKGRAMLRNLKAIYISHLHADHHIGLIGILRARRRCFEEFHEDDRLLLLAPLQISSWLSFFSQHIEKISDDFLLCPNAEMIPTPLRNEKLMEMGIEGVSTCLVPHCPHSFGVAVNLTNGMKITYSGDTKPSKELVELGRDSTVLIHEATMEDELEHEALVKMHSTVSQAIDQGKAMNAKYTILTHFSQRYAKLPRIDALERNVGIAFDNMQVTIEELELLPPMHEALKLMFSEHCEEMEQKALKRAYKKQRLTNSRSSSPTAKT
uniref:Zinc phosphodiesterase ELAC protein 2 n=1 Tax=Lutzomyia longipalpis TaxID=7200 RepID=A0A7G3AR59_LUTLO